MEILQKVDLEEVDKANNEVKHYSRMKDRAVRIAVGEDNGQELDEVF